MRKFKFGLLASLLVLFSVSVLAEGRLPANIQTAFQKLYPQVTNVEWEQMAGCYVAEFILFYAPDGKLLQSLDVTELGGEIYPGLFFND